MSYHSQVLLFAATFAAALFVIGAAVIVLDAVCDVVCKWWEG